MTCAWQYRALMSALAGCVPVMNAPAAHVSWQQVETGRFDGSRTGAVATSAARLELGDGVDAVSTLSERSASTDGGDYFFVDVRVPAGVTAPAHHGTRFAPYAGGHAILTTPERCAAYEEEVWIDVRDDGAVQASVVRHTVVRGRWIGRAPDSDASVSPCARVAVLDEGDREPWRSPPATGVDVYRVMIRARIGDVGQRVEVGVLREPALP